MPSSSLPVKPHRLALFMILFLPAILLLTCSDDEPAEAPEETVEATAGSAAGEGGPSVEQAIDLLYRQQDPAAALPVLDALVAAQPEDARFHRMRANAQMQLGDLEAARDDFVRAAELEPDHQGAVYGLATVHARMGDADQAFARLEALADSGTFDLSGIPLDPNLAPLADDPRFAALLPGPEAFADPFVEETRVIHEWVGEATGDQFGWIARRVEDVDGDGVAEAVTSAPTFGDDDRGRVYLYSGASGRLLWTFDGEAGDQLGTGVEAAGDVNADGVPDVAAGGPGGDRVVALSGRDGSLILEIAAAQEGEQLGRHVRGVGDADGDGHSDLLVGAPRNDEAGDDAGRAALHSGADGRLLRQWLGEEAGDRMGETVAGGTAGDDVWLILGAPDAGDGDRGRVYVYRGLEGEARFVVDSDEQGSELGGMFLSLVGDVDADGTPDVYASDWSHGGKGPQTGQAVVHSGADGSRLHAWGGEAPGDGFGIGVSDAGDVDGDGHADLAIGAWQHGAAAPGGGKVYLYSGADGSLLRTWTSQVMGETFGFDTTNLGDVNGDGTIDLLLTSAWSAKNGARSGRVFVVSGR